MPINIELKLSIVLPIYNVEPYLEKCIRSLEDQDIPKGVYELICVNDGSPDNCLQIIKNLQKEFSNIVLIDQKNQGVSVARNNGLKKTKGKYLMFVDTDDSIEENSLGGLLRFVEEKDLDAVYSPLSFVELDGGKTQTFYKKNNENTIFDGPDLYFAVRGKNIQDPDRCYSIVYKKDFILSKNLFFTREIPILEDGEFLARVLCLVNKGMIYNNPYYLRLNRPDSAMAAFKSEKAVQGFIKAAINLKKFKKNQELNSKQTGLINGRIVKFSVLALDTNLNNIKEFFKVKKDL